MKAEKCTSYIGGDLVNVSKLPPPLAANFHANGDKLYFNYTENVPEIGDVVKVTKDNVKEIQSNARIHSEAKLDKRADLMEKYGKAGATVAKTARTRDIMV